MASPKTSNLLCANSPDTLKPGLYLYTEEMSYVPPSWVADGVGPRPNPAGAGPVRRKHLRVHAHSPFAHQKRLTAQQDVGQQMDPARRHQDEGTVAGPWPMVAGPRRERLASNAALALSSPHAIFWLALSLCFRHRGGVYSKQAVPSG